MESRGELSFVAETLGVPPARVRSSIHDKALACRRYTGTPIEHLTAELTKSLVDRLLKCALRGERTSLVQALDDAAERICPRHPGPRTARRRAYP
jgi:hypothetical protein